MLKIRKATLKDFDKIIKIYSYAQDYMIKENNKTQWGKTYPNEKLIKQDIKENISYVVYNEENVYGVFALYEKEEESYKYIENGTWLNDDEYVTIHRIASNGEVKGIFKCVLDYCKSMSKNIRIDTHEKNKTMKKLIEKNGFEKCGIIYVADKTPRIAYHLVQKDN